MPRLSTVGAASTGSFGFGLAGRPSSIAIDYLVAGGGGTGGSGVSPGGGGAGQIRFLTGSLSTKTSYSAVVAGLTGTSSFNSQSASGGSSGIGSNGGTSAAGFGGGNGNSVYLPVTGAPWTAGGDAYAGGGGGGAAGGGQDGQARNSPDYFAQGGGGGNGVQWTVNGVFYGIGGGGVGAAFSNTDGYQPGISANGGGGSTFGSGNIQGGVIVSYVFKTQLFTGGTVTSSGTFPNIRWTHTFSTSGTLAPAP